MQLVQTEIAANIKYTLGLNFEIKNVRYLINIFAILITCQNDNTSHILG